MSVATEMFRVASQACLRTTTFGLIGGGSKFFPRAKDAENVKNTIIDCADYKELGIKSSAKESIKNAIIRRDLEDIELICELEAQDSIFAHCVDSYCELARAILTDKLPKILQEALPQLL